MSELISGKEAKVVWANGEQLQVAHATIQEWEALTDNYMLSVFDNGSYVFRLKTRTITINNIEVPAPFEPEIGDKYWIIETSSQYSYSYISRFENDSQDKCLIQLGAWRTEEEIKQVVAALKKIFVINNQ